MDHPIEISFLGAFVIIFAAAVVCGLVTRWLLGTTGLRTLFDIALGTLGGFILIFYLPMHGYVVGHSIGWRATVVLAAVLPVAAVHVFTGRRARARFRR